MLRFLALVLLASVVLAKHHHHHHRRHHKHKHHHHNSKKLHWSHTHHVKLHKVGGEVLKEAFDEWKAEFGKTYANKEEEGRHFLTFLDNWKMILDHNKKANETFTMGLNQFADLTPHEFRYYVHGPKGSCLQGHVRKMWKETDGSSSSFSSDEEVRANPASVDWSSKGKVTPVKNQGQCGSCWAFSTTGSLECRTAISTGKLVSLSEQQLVDCSKAEGNQGCNGGLMDDAFKYIEKSGGLCTESEYPYKAHDGLCKSTSCGQKYDPIKGFKDVTKDSYSSLETAAAAGCVSVAIEADQQAFQFYKSGILSGRCGTRLDHGVLVVGYGEEGGKKYWKVKNSWGASWGEQGYVRMCKECNKDFGKGECGILEQPSYPLV